MTSGVFFPSASVRHRRAAPGRPRRRARRAVAAGGDRGRVDAEQGGNAPVAAPPALERLEPGEQTQLPLVEQAGEQHDRNAQILRHQVGVGQGAYESGRGQQKAPRAQLLRLLRPVGRAIQELGGELMPRQPPVADEFAEGILGADMQQVVQLLAEVSGLGVADERFGGCDQGADPGKADPGERPQTTLVEVDELIEGVVAAAMRVAGPGGQVLELAERRAPAGAGAERGDHLGQRGDGLLAEQGDERVGGELGWSHCGTITCYVSRNDAIIRAGLRLQKPENVHSDGTWRRARGCAGPVCSTTRLQAFLGNYFCADPKSRRLSAGENGDRAASRQRRRLRPRGRRTTRRPRPGTAARWPPRPRRRRRPAPAAP